MISTQEGAELRVAMAGLATVLALTFPLGQPNAAPSELSVGTARTSLGNRALRVAAEHAKEWSGKDLLLEDGNTTRNGVHWLFYLTPEVDLRTGDADALQGLMAKLVGAGLRFHEKTVARQPVVDTGRLFWSFPISAGIESDAEFRNVTVLFEAGVAPWFQKGLPAPVRSARFGIFVQAGHKFSAHDDTTALAGGAADESKEEPDEGVLRLKTSARWSSPRLAASKFFAGAGLIGTADYWRDLLNAADYYRLTAKLRLHLTDKESFDWTYEKGAGAPSFNKGEQFSANLTLAF